MTSNSTMRMKTTALVGLFFAMMTSIQSVQGFTIIPTESIRITSSNNAKLFQTKTSFSVEKDDEEANKAVMIQQQQQQQQQHRRSFVQNLFFASAIGGGAVGVGLVHPKNAEALVKGNAPPPPKKKVTDDSQKKCTNVEECQEMAERLAAEQEAKERASAIPAQVAPGGTRYREMEAKATSSSENAREVKTGDDVKLYYKVLKLGKRSYDGLSGEGTVVFSRGYGLEDDEKKPGEKFFQCTVGDSSIIDALNDGLLGMTVGSTRRIAILPQKGWRKPTRECDGGPGGSGSGGELKTDYVVVPTATMVATEICFDKSKLPFPTTYAEQRRMAQRFDQSLIVEVELVDIA